MIDVILNQLKKVKSHGPGRWTACCPAHDDRSPSFAVTIQQNGKISLKCWAGCSGQEIVQSLGITLEQLYPDWDAQKLHREFPMPEGVRERHKEKKRQERIQHLERTLEFYKSDIDQGKQFSAKDRNLYMDMFKELQQLRAG